MNCGATKQGKASKANPRPIHEIAREIKKEWPKSYFGAVPYLEAMLTLSNASDSFGWDPATEIVTYFLANAQSWRGDVARRIKNELKAYSH